MFFILILLGAFAGARAGYLLGGAIFSSTSRPSFDLNILVLA